jgi:hypothetical protein
MVTYVFSSGLPGPWELVQWFTIVWARIVREGMSMMNINLLGSIASLIGLAITVYQLDVVQRAISALYMRV